MTVREITKLWNKTLKKVRESISDTYSFDYFLANTYIYEIKGNNIILVCDKLAGKPTIERNYLKLLENTVSDLAEEKYKITVVLEQDIENTNVKVSTPTKVNESPKETRFFENSYINTKLTFNNFVVGDFNKEAHKAALFVARNGGSLFNPLFIYSHSGLGKTHLLHAVANEVKASRMPDANILYTPTNLFVDEYINFVKAEKNTESLREFFKKVDILLIDDIQFLAGKVATEEMFFYIFQDMVNAGKRIIITSDRQPNELKGIEDRLVTRFTQGLTVKIDEPDVDASVEILKTKIKEAGLDLERFDENVICFIAEKFSRDVRELEGALNRMVFYYMNLEDDERFTMDVAIKAVSSIKGGKDIANQISEKKIIDTVADYYNLTPSQITGSSREAQITLARHISMYLIRKHLDVPLKKVGAMFGGKDHTTVMNGISKVDKELKTNKQLQEAINELESKIKE